MLHVGPTGKISDQLGLDHERLTDEFGNVVECVVA